MRRQLFVEKLNNTTGLLVAGGLGVFMGLVLMLMGFKGGVALTAGLVGVTGIFACMFNPILGVSILLSIAFMVQLIGKYTTFPVGTSMDALLCILLFGILIQQIRERNWSFAKSPVSTWVLIWIYYNLFQALNPWAESRLAWLYTVRSLAVLLMLYFVAAYCMNNLSKVKWLITWCIALTFGAALYGLKQEWIGFAARELSWLMEDEERFQLIVQWNRMRVFSIMNDPTTCGIMMAYMGTFCFVLATGPYQTWKRIMLAVAGSAMYLTMAYAGSRTPFVLVPIGLFFYIVLNPTRQVLIAAAITLVLGAGFMMKSTSNAVVYRIQSAFTGTEDASVQVRMKNQKYIQPFIHNHPIGAGLGSCGLWGRRFNPDSWLSKFPHDSGYVRIAVEMGWVGLIIYLSFLFVVMREGIYHYLRVKDPKIRNLYLGLLTAMFMLIIANYPQEAIVQLPTSMVFYILLAALVKLKDFDTHTNVNTNSTESSITPQTPDDLGNTITLRK